MTPSTFYYSIINPGLEELSALIKIPYSERAATLLLAIALHESKELTSRVQLVQNDLGYIVPGPAHGFWQFEKTGVSGVLDHIRTKQQAITLCEHCTVRPLRDDIWRAIEGHDFLALGFARLLLWLGSGALPEITPTNEQAAFDYYIKCWRPNPKYRERDRKRWSASWKTALVTIPGEPHD